MVIQSNELLQKESNRYQSMDWSKKVCLNFKSFDHPIVALLYFKFSLINFFSDEISQQIAFEKTVSSALWSEFEMNELLK